ncbi:2613_t:CDS:2, partial [Dentiscutata erythropus]
NNLAIYLTNVEEIPTPEDEPQSEPTTNQLIEKLIQVEALNPEQRQEARHVLETYPNILSTELDKMGYAEDELLSNNNAENDAQYMNLNKAYLVDIPQWGELTEGLEFQDSSNEEYEDTGYSYYQSRLGHD